MANIDGTSGDDSLTGTANTDSMSGLAGNDTLFGLEGDDTLVGGLDNDSLFGQAGNDFLQGGPGSDFIDGGTNTSNGDVVSYLEIRDSVPLAGVNITLNGATQSTVQVKATSWSPIRLLGQNLI